MSDATLSPRFHDLMHVLLASIERRQRRRRGDRALECKLTWAQILEDLWRDRRAFTLSYPESKRSLARWLAGMERDKFIHRTTETERDPLGRILWRLTNFRFRVNGLLWIKKFWPGGRALLARSIVPKVAVRLKSYEIQNQRPVDKTIHRPEEKARKSAALRRPVAQLTSRAVRRPGRALVRGGAAPRRQRARKPPARRSEKPKAKAKARRRS